MNLFVENTKVASHMADSKLLMEELVSQLEQAYFNVRRSERSGWGTGESVSVGIHPNSACCHTFTIGEKYEGVKYRAHNSLRCTERYTNELKERYPDVSIHERSWYENGSKEVYLYATITRDNLNTAIKDVALWLKRDGFTLR
jgi:hypothetical protein